MHSTPPLTGRPNCSGLLGRTPLRPPPPQHDAAGPPPLFRSSRPDSIETPRSGPARKSGNPLFRSSRPDSIETKLLSAPHMMHGRAYCSGLLGRTPLRLKLLKRFHRPRSLDCSGLLGRTPLRPYVRTTEVTVGEASLFRSSRPDSIETPDPLGPIYADITDCSGLLGRTPLRRRHPVRPRWSYPHCSGLLGRTPLRLRPDLPSRKPIGRLFRSSRPDSIET